MENKEEKTINEVYVRLSGSAPVAFEPGMDEEVNLRINGDVVKVEDRSNQDGTYDRYIVVKPRFIEEWEN